jgi:hypothetical protein
MGVPDCQAAVIRPSCNANNPCCKLAGKSAMIFRVNASKI